MADVRDYERAERLLPFTRSKLVAGGAVKPVWIEKGQAFWYLRESPAGHEFILVDPGRKCRAPAFDHGRLADALKAASGEPVDAAALPFRSIRPEDDAVAFDAFGAQWRCDLDTYACEKIEGHISANPLEVKSPDGKWAVSRRGHDLWIRSSATGEERALTSDGIADNSYASPLDSLSFGALLRKVGVPHLPPLVAWSPDSRSFVTHRIDQSGLRLSHLIETAPPNGEPPILHSYRFALPGDEKVAMGELIVFDAETGATVRAESGPMLMWLMSPLMSHETWWAEDGATIYFLEQPRDLQTLWLKRLDPKTGEVRTLIEEKGEGYLHATQILGAKPIVRVLSSGEEALWFSQRDGWGHLYLYDTKDGALLNQVTSGEWLVEEILHVDEQARVVTFIAAGLVASDPYRRQVCRVGLDGHGFTRLGDDDLDHIVTIPPSGAYYVDSASAVDTPPVVSVRDWNGKLMVELEQADISKLLEAGWTAPERFCVKAADGVTDIYGNLYRPHGFDSSQRYAVIDSPYPGPQHGRVNPNFGDRVHYDVESVAALGFVVVTLDGRGTPGRSKAFLDLARGHLENAGFLEDHVAAIRQLAETRPWMDLDRVGIFGLSGGGFATVRALCTYPDFYKVGVSSCGNHDQRLYQASWGETHIGPLEGNEEAYLAASNVELAERLQGKLLLIHGEMDDNVHPHMTMRLVDRLIAANKDFDLLIVPGAEHAFVGYIGYVYRRRWDFLVRHLQGVEPPAGYRIADPPIRLDGLIG
ncbi:S9 family peptidase [Sphingosinicella rhizophila]|uniref:DPP IV N-terminal domain-containing protein n=1 Tax=Sphingosinicella rhizophila TaxID=3050082 RepID=A0ABU3Q5P3_9SPHN|nr:DPP IV N-terminal domain-containing protein [Sphingosinicella sp. GR2756]MDT9598728.1 DPP IV N-terminal domain-containing protein [Sphingosinicella sp. GR2756]